MPLTPLQERFCREYLIDLNGAAAYLRACANRSVTLRSATNYASHLRSRPAVVARIAELQAAREERTEIDSDWALKRLKREAEFEGEGASHAARVSALSLALRHLGMLVADAPHPDRPTFDLAKLTDEQKAVLLAALRCAAAPAAALNPHAD